MLTAAVQRGHHGGGSPRSAGAVAPPRRELRPHHPAAGPGPGVAAASPLSALQDLLQDS